MAILPRVRVESPFALLGRGECPLGHGKLTSDWGDYCRRCDAEWILRHRRHTGFQMIVATRRTDGLIRTESVTCEDPVMALAEESAERIRGYVAGALERLLTT